MFTANINEINNIKFEPKFEKAINWLRTTDLKSIPCGKYEIDGTHVFAYVQEYDSLTWEEAKYETHNVYYDLQYIVEGAELFGYTRKALLKPSTDYDSDKDLQFYHDPDYVSGVALKPGDFIIVSPLEAHKPKPALYKPGHVKKIVMKIEY